MKVFYPESYGPHVDTQVEARRTSRRARLGRIIRRVSNIDTHTIPALRPGRLLEIGCGSGSYLAEMRAQGWHVSGIEPSETAAARARAHGLDVHAGCIDTAPEPTAPYDLVVAWMAIEHLHDPVGVLRAVARRTRAGGVLALSAPNAAALERRLFGSAWYALDVPRHLYHFTPRTLSLVLQRSGWEMARILHQPILGNAVASVGNVLSDAAILPGLSARLRSFPHSGRRWNYVLYPLASILAWLGQTGRMTVWAGRAPEPS
jgi:SAM-dependent methyltransferase